MTQPENSLVTRILTRYADFVVRRPLGVLVTLLVLAVAGTYGASRLTINSNQLDLISQDLPEVLAVKRVIDMAGGTGHLMLALRSEDEAQMKAVSDDLAAMLEADKENVRFLTFRIPMDYLQQKMVLFVATEDLIEAKNRIMRYVRAEMRRANPFFFELKKSEPPKLDLSDLVMKYSQVAKKSILDDYYISSDRKMILLLIKPMWDVNDLGKTKTFIDKLNGELAAYSQNNKHGVKLVEDYSLMGKTGTIAYGYTGSYKTSLDDSYAIADSLRPVTLLAFLAILLITVAFFRKIAPSFIVMAGVTLGTVLTMGFTYLTIGELNMVTSCLAGILMGFGVDFGIHLTFRTRIELGEGKPYDRAVRDAIVNAGRPASVAAIVTGGAFLVLLVSEFAGFSQFGFLSACGTLITALTMFAFVPSVLLLLGRRSPDLPARLVGTMRPRAADIAAGHELRVPNPKRILIAGGTVVVLLCIAALPWSSAPLPSGRSLTLWERVKSGVRFNYNTRALMPEDQYSVKLQDEINERFQISSDPIAVPTKTLDEAKEVYDEITKNPAKYPAVDQVVSLFSFVPNPEVAAANIKVLREWKEEIKDLDPSILPENLQAKMPLFQKILDAEPFGVHDIPELYAARFRSQPSTRPENQGYLTYIYPRVDLWDGKQMLEFADQTNVITTKQGHSYRAAGSCLLFAKLARIVLWDGKVTVLLTVLWILLMLFVDFRNPRLVAASIIPLGLGLTLMLGLMSLIDIRLNFMNIIILPIVLGFGVSHGVYLLHRFLEGTSPLVALRSVGAAVASSTLTMIAGFGSLLAASHNGLKSIGAVASLGLTTTLLVSFTVLAAVLQMLHDRRRAAKEIPDFIASQLPDFGPKAVRVESSPGALSAESAGRKAASGEVDA